MPATIGDRAADAGFQATFHDIYDRFRSDSRPEVKKALPLAAPASSAGVERVFSAAGKMHDKGLLTGCFRLFLEKLETPLSCFQEKSCLFLLHRVLTC